jgi:hypothetical protein
MGSFYIVNDDLKLTKIYQKTVNLGGYMAKGHQIFDGFDYFLISLDCFLENQGLKRFQCITMGELSRGYFDFLML